MVKKKRHRLDYILLLAMTVVVALLLVFMINRYHLNDELAFEPDLDVVTNPLMGYAPYAENQSACQKTNLVFIKLKWADWEPEAGRYDVDYLESQYHISRWKAAGKHAVLRFICDEPGKTDHADIPDWLLEATGDGSHYTTDVGSGYSPNYENLYFIERHSKAIAALAEYFNHDDFLAYVEFGSLGFWGEWHARDGAGNSLMPSAQTCWDYVLAYSEKFKNVRFLMRRSYVQAVDAGLGLYNDMLGDRAQTDRWLNWTVNGGNQETTGDSLPILAYDGFWENAPVGGELTSQPGPEVLLQDDLTELLDQMEASHMTFVGPNCPDAEEYNLAYDAILRRLGYRYYISRLSTTFSFAENMLTLKLDWENAGTAPLYWDWPVMVKIFDSKGALVYYETLNLRLSELIPGKIITTTTDIPYLDSFQSGMSVGISIHSYDGDDIVQLAMEAEVGEDCQIIYSYQ